ncbi:MAG: pullulanase-type alpha-1,6-glucosidase, partial [Aggregatilineales bacterium]
GYEKPELVSFNDISLYELHIRDFSAFDETVSEDLRGTYAAFTLADSNGMTHLGTLADSGMTHVHLLPTFDIATINENKDRWFLPDYEALAAMPPDSEDQQAFIDERRDLDPFNWGYDPYHYNVPEGSYSTNPDDTSRIVEYRAMVQSLNNVGLRVVQDVVYNHTNSSGQSSRSVLDKVVPGYYHRLNNVGRVETSTCCQNTATEHNMMRRLMIDSLVLHATQYKVDGFRFDLMGHHMLSDMVAARDVLDALTLENDGVDGSKIYVYGEGWDFGEVVSNTRGVNATQLNIAGTGIGVFNDRLRDAVRGGNPFGGQLEQGLSNGVFSNPNGEDDLNEDAARAMLLADQTRVGLAGNLAEYSFTGFDGETVTGADVDYNGAPAGYTAAPVENILYVSAHDNETLFDAIVYKAPLDTSAEDRVRMQILGLSYVTYAQGVPFYHAGTELLRSKSMDRNSYNSGDWFNRLDFTYQTNNFGVGLPPAGDNQSEWELMQPRLADESINPAPENIEATLARFMEMMQVRYSTPLFRLETANQVMERVVFHNTGAEQIPGIIVMSISDTIGEDLDPAHDMVVVVFNAGADTLDFTVDDLSGMSFELHPILADSSDETMQTSSFDSDSGTFSVPALTTAVFVLPQS